MKKLFSLVLSSILLLSIAGCGSRDTGVSESVSGSEQSPSSASYQSTDSSEASDIKSETAVFALGLDGKDGKTIGVGDSIGGWTLKDLQISYDEENNVQMLEALFEGDVELLGTISRSALVEEGYDFKVAKEYESKMPYYISPEMGQKSEIWFMLNIPADIAETFTLEHGEQQSCKIVISDYRFIFAYMTAPASATVTSLEML